MKEHGAILIDGIQRGTTHNCPHCNGHFLVAASDISLSDARKTMGNLAYPRVFCQKCGRLTCGRPGCNPEVYACVPLEARLDHYEGRVTKYTPDMIELVVDGLA
jgi:hypothetical protein